MHDACVTDEKRIREKSRRQILLLTILRSIFALKIVRTNVEDNTNVIRKYKF